MLYVDQKYVGIISSRLRNFKRKGSSLYQWACTECGDSTKKKKSAHSYAFPADDSLRVYCQRCGYSVWFGKFLKHFDEEVYQEYLLEKFQDEARPLRDDLQEATRVASSAPKPVSFPKIELPRVSDLPENHPAVMLCERRMIPPERWSGLYHADDYIKLVRKFQPERYKEVMFSEPRLVIPVLSRLGRLIGFQGRSYESNAKAKYMTTRLDEDEPFMYGQERADFSRKIVVVEGPIDSMFLDNALASLGGVIERELEKYGDLPKSNFVIAYDNEPRSATTIKKMRSAIQRGYPIFVWPENWSTDIKDFNDLYLKFMELHPVTNNFKTVVMDTIQKRTFSDLEAELEIQSWSKV